jgi:butyryl-CoA dehydrogenase
LSSAVARALGSVSALTMELAAKGLAGDVDAMMLHSTDYLDLFSVLVVAWQHLAMATAAVRKVAVGEEEAAFLRGKILSAEHWILTECPRLDHLVALCRAGEDSYARIRPSEL